MDEEEFKKQINATYYQLYEKHGPGLLQMTLIEEENRCDVNYILEADCNPEQLKLIEAKDKLPIMIIKG